MSLQTNFPTVDSIAYQCAQCYVVANSSSFVPFQQCINECKEASSTTRKCIQEAVNENQFVLPENMSCVKSKIVQSAVPPSQCQSQCLANYNQCLNQC
jgi:hypothetical protein